MDSLSIMDVDKPMGGGNRNVLMHLGQTYKNYIRDGIL